MAKYNIRIQCQKIILKYITITTITIVTLNEMKFRAWEPPKSSKIICDTTYKNKPTETLHDRGITDIYEHMLEEWDMSTDDNVIKTYRLLSR